MLIGHRNGTKVSAILCVLIIALTIAMLVTPQESNYLHNERDLIDRNLTYQSQLKHQWQIDFLENPHATEVTHLVTSTGSFQANLFIENTNTDLDRDNQLIPNNIGWRVTEFDLVLWNGISPSNLRLNIDGTKCINITGFKYHSSKSESAMQSSYCDLAKPLSLKVFRTSEQIGFSITNNDGEEDLFAENVESAAIPHLSNGPITQSYFGEESYERGQTLLITPGKLKVPATGEYYSYAKSNRIRWLYWATIIAIIGLFISLYRHDPKFIFQRIRNFKSNINTTDYKRFCGFGLILLGTFTIGILMSLPLGKLGQHPFDSYTLNAYSYIAGVYGLGSLYPISDSVPNAWALGGIPALSAIFMYPPIATYIFWVIGSISQAADWFRWQELPSVPVISLLRMSGMVVHTTLSLAIFMFAYKILRSYKMSLIAFILVFLNPVILLGNITWIQTDVHMITLVTMGSGLIFLWSRLRIGWTLVILAILTKPSTLIFLPIIILLSLKHFGALKTSFAVITGILFSLVILTPFFSTGYHIEMFYLPLITQMSSVSLTSRLTSFVSSDAYTFWTLITNLYGTSGFANFTVPSGNGSQFSIFGTEVTLSFLSASRILIVYVTAFYAWVIWKSKNISQLESLFLIGAYVANILFISTTMSSRYYAFPIPLLVLGCIGLTPFRNLSWYLLGTLTLIGSLGILGVLSYLATVLPYTIPEGSIISGYIAEKISEFWLNNWTIRLCSTFTIIAFILSMFRIDSLRNNLDIETNKEEVP